MRFVHESIWNAYFPLLPGSTGYSFLSAHCIAHLFPAVMASCFSRHFGGALHCFLRGVPNQQNDINCLFPCPTSQLASVSTQPRESCRQASCCTLILKYKMCLFSAYMTASRLDFLTALADGREKISKTDSLNCLTRPWAEKSVVQQETQLHIAGLLREIL